MNKLRIWLACATTAIALHAQTFTSLHSFDGKDGAGPAAPLVQADDGSLYGTTLSRGAYGHGTVFKINTTGTLATPHNFCPQTGCPDGAEPEGLVLAANGDLYGTTYFGGAGHAGTIFRIAPAGELTPLYSFCSQTGCARYPEAGLVQGTDGDFYGVTEDGGADGPGVVFKITQNGSLTTLHSFCSQSGCADGEIPYAGLIQAADGNLYGTTTGGGANGQGTVFRITPSGQLTTLYNFCAQVGCADGADPVAALVQSRDGSFYGTTYYGGTAGLGTVFRITPAGTLTTLHSFCSESGCADGQGSWAQLIQATDGNFYGTTYAGGIHGGGTIFSMTPDGTLTTLYSFCAQSACADGKTLYAGLVQDTDGTFYGTTYAGGARGFGTVFSLSVGLAPFVKTLPDQGTVGSTAAVPDVATTGTLRVVTPSATLWLPCAPPPRSGTSNIMSGSAASSNTWTADLRAHQSAS